MERKEAFVLLSTEKGFHPKFGAHLVPPTTAGRKHCGPNAGKWLIFVNCLFPGIFGVKFGIHLPGLSDSESLCEQKEDEEEQTGGKSATSKRTRIENLRFTWILQYRKQQMPRDECRAL